MDVSIMGENIGETTLFLQECFHEDGCDKVRLMIRKTLLKTIRRIFILAKILMPCDITVIHTTNS